MSGAIGGIAGVLAMDAFSLLWISGAQRNSWEQESPGPQRGQRPEVEVAIKARQHQADPDEVATTAIAERLARAAGLTLSRRQRGVAVKVIPYLYGAAAGATYGACVEYIPALRSGGGIWFGVLLWLGEAGMGVPLLGLSKGPAKYSVAEHLFSGVGHMVFGAVAERARRGVRGGIK